MSNNFEKNYQKIIETLEGNIKDKAKFDLVKKQLDDVIESVVKDFSLVLDKYDEKLQFIEENNNRNEVRISDLEDKISEFEKMIELEDYDIFVTCPYCGYEIQLEYDESVNETICPECQELIEIDWNDDEN